MIEIGITVPRKTVSDITERFATATKEMSGALVTATNRSTASYRGTARNLVRVRTAALVNSITVTKAIAKGRTVTGSTEATALYARYQEEGTGIYGPFKRSITPKNKDYMQFKINGHWVRTKRVKGVKPGRYMLGSFTQNTPDTFRRFAFEVGKVIARIFGD